MKLRLISLAALAAFAGQAFAADANSALRTVAAPDGTTVTTSLFVAGSSALGNLVKGLVAYNCTSSVVWGDTANSGGDQSLYLCKGVKSGSTFAAKGIAVGANVLVYERKAGGSIFGVNPIVNGQADGKLGSAVGFIKPSTCGAAGNTCDTTTGTTSAIPDVGLSDLEGAVFQDADHFTTSAGANKLTATQLGQLNGTATVLQGFGIVVNNGLYSALQAAGHTVDGTTSGVATLSSAEVSSLLNAGVNAQDGWGSILGSAYSGRQLNICTRTTGSGTKATAYIQFTGSTYCSKGHGATLLTAGNSDATAISDANGTLWVQENSSSGTVKSCLNAVETASALGVGIMGLDNPPGASDNWKFVALDGNTANIANAKAGKYNWAYEAYANTNKTTFTSANLGNAYKLGSALIAELSNQTIINTVGGGIANGVASVTDADTHALRPTACSQLIYQQ
jgi:hypothetical protein